MPHHLIVNGVPWYDDRGLPVNAHGACLVEDAGRYYLFGEYKTDDENRFVGFSCYSSPDLVTWTFERLVLPPQEAGLLGPDRIGERIKVMRRPSTGTYVMYMHTDNLGYTDPCIAVGTCDTVAGEYTLQGPLMLDGEPIRRWDMGTFQDADGTGYLLVHEGDIYRLTDEYTEAAEKVTSNIAPGGESPAMFVIDGLYFLLFSNKTSWERNDNYYLTAPSVAGPWSHRGLFAPEGSLTHNSQCTFVHILSDFGAPMYMGDRWSFPHQASSATYVWLPLKVDGSHLSVPDFWPAWDARTLAPVDLEGDTLALDLASDEVGANRHVTFTGRQVALVGRSDPHSGYGLVEITTPDGQVVATQLIDFYSKVTDDGVRYLSPELPSGRYTLRVTVTGESPVWFKKNGDRLGSDGRRVTTRAVVVQD